MKNLNLNNNLKKIKDLFRLIKIVFKCAISDFKDMNH